MTRKALVKRAIKELNLDEKLYSPTSVHAAISTAKNNLHHARGLPQPQPTAMRSSARIYERYQELLLASNAVDFDDLLLWAVQLLEENPGVREKLRAALSSTCWWMNSRIPTWRSTSCCATWPSVHQNIFVVGDEDQSIYRWRGADYRNVLRFEEDYPAAPEDPAGAELPLHPDRAGCGPGGDRPQPPPHAQEPLHRARRGREDHAVRSGG